jgi:protein required for attachment to host cells
MLIPHKTLIVVADGAHARFFRNIGQEIQLAAEGELRPGHHRDGGPAGVRPKDSSPRETDEAIFSKQMAKELLRRAESGDFNSLVLMADPQTLGEMRPLLHKEVQTRVIAEFAKDLTKASIADIQKALH